MKNRREFLTIAGMAVAGFSIGRGQGQPLSTHQSIAEQDVFQVISRYGSRQSVTRAPGSTGTVSIKVRMRSHKAFAQTFTTGDLPFDRIHAAGNTLRFRHLGVGFVVEHLT